MKIVYSKYDDVNTREELLTSYKNKKTMEVLQDVDMIIDSIIILHNEQYDSYMMLFKTDEVVHRSFSKVLVKELLKHKERTVKRFTISTKENKAKSYSYQYFSNIEYEDDELEEWNIDF